MPAGTGMGGGILYNRTVYEELGLEVPTDLGRVRGEQRERSRRPGSPRSVPTFGDTWTSQLFVLADYYNVAQAVPTSPRTTRPTRPSTPPPPPRCRVRAPRRKPTTKGWWQRRLRVDHARRRARRCCSRARSRSTRCSRSPWVGDRRRRPRGNAGTSVSSPSRATDAATERRDAVDAAGAPTSPQTTEHPEEAKKFLAFIASVEGTEAMTAAVPPAGPYLHQGRHAARRRAAGREGRAGLHRRPATSSRRWSSSRR